MIVMMINALYSFGIIKYHTYIEYSRDLNKNKEAPHWLSQEFQHTTIHLLHHAPTPWHMPLHLPAKALLNLSHSLQPH